MVWQFVGVELKCVLTQHQKVKTLADLKEQFFHNDYRKSKVGRSNVGNNIDI